VTKLLDLTENFKISRPVFCLQLDSSGRNIRANTSHPKHIYRPKPIEGDPLSELVCENYREVFDVRGGHFQVDKGEIANRAMQQIRGSISNFIEQNLEMRNPRQSKLYRWAYRNMPNSSEINDVLVMVYKYLRSFCNADNMRGHDADHLKNGFALLEAIMEKYEQ